MLDLPLVELVKLGFLGFAVAMMLMCFYALIKMMKLSREIPREQFAVMSRTIIFFLGGTLFAIGLGIVSAYVSPEVNVVFEVTPASLGEDDFRVKVAGKRLQLPAEFEAPIKDRNQVTIDLSGITDQVKLLEWDVKSLKAQMEQATEKINALNSQRVSDKQARIEGISSVFLLRRESGF